MIQFNSTWSRYICPILKSKSNLLVALHEFQWHPTRQASNRQFSRMNSSNEPKNVHNGKGARPLLLQGNVDKVVVLPDEEIYTLCKSFNLAVRQSKSPYVTRSNLLLLHTCKKVNTTTPFVQRTVNMHFVTHNN
jgi:hypothetical protein